MKKIIVGGGAAGMMAAIQSAGRGQEVTLIEKNEKLGKKLFITGKGRCNLTNACDVSDLFSAVVSNPKFLYSAFYAFTNQDTIHFFHSLGLKTKTERGQRVFPGSDKSSDVISALERECRRLGVEIRLNREADHLLVRQGRVCGVSLRDGTVEPADAVVFATGGVTYPSTGSTGDGHRMAEEAGHRVTKLRPGLTGMTTREAVGERLRGLTLKNCGIYIAGGGAGKKQIRDFGELLFTHYGVSGPVILTASSRAGDWLADGPLELHIDMKPALDTEVLDRRVLRDFEKGMNRSAKNALQYLLPKSMILPVLERAGIPEDRKVHQITREERRRLLNTVKDFTLTLTGLRDRDEAIITRGGVSVREVDPSTMESRVVKGLYFAGEILDLDALTGGFNLQIAWSTGYLAGTAPEM